MSELHEAWSWLANSSDAFFPQFRGGNTLTEYRVRHCVFFVAVRRVPLRDVLKDRVWEAVR